MGNILELVTIKFSLGFFLVISGYCVLYELDHSSKRSFFRLASNETDVFLATASSWIASIWSIQLTLLLPVLLPLTVELFESGILFSNDYVENNYKHFPFPSFQVGITAALIFIYARNREKLRVGSTYRYIKHAAAIWVEYRLNLMKVRAKQKLYSKGLVKNVDNGIDYDETQTQIDDFLEKHGLPEERTEQSIIKNEDFTYQLILLLVIISITFFGVHSMGNYRDIITPIICWISLNFIVYFFLKFFLGLTSRGYIFRFDSWGMKLLFKKFRGETKNSYLTKLVKQQQQFERLMASGNKSPNWSEEDKKKFDTDYSDLINSPIELNPVISDQTRIMTRSDFVLPSDWIEFPTKWNITNAILSREVAIKFNIEKEKSKKFNFKSEMTLLNFYLFPIIIPLISFIVFPIFYYFMLLTDPFGLGKFNNKDVVIALSITFVPLFWRYFSIIAKYQIWHIVPNQRLLRTYSRLYAVHPNIEKGIRQCYQMADKLYLFFYNITGRKILYLCLTVFVPAYYTYFSLMQK